MFHWLLAIFSKSTNMSINIASIMSKIYASQTKQISIETFTHPKLTQDELFNGTRLGFDSWADSCCAGRHAFVESFIDGKFINASGFSSSLGQLHNLPVAMYYTHMISMTVILYYLKIIMLFTWVRIWLILW